MKKVEYKVNHVFIEGKGNSYYQIFKEGKKIDLQKNKFKHVRSAMDACHKHAVSVGVFPNHKVEV